MARQGLSAFEMERAEEVSSVLDFYYTAFTTYLATTIAFTEALPEEINNQIRDAFTHLSRANAAARIEEVRKECELARAHIGRANRDCLKASIIKARIELDQLVDDVAFYHGFLTPAMKAGLDTIKRERRAAYIAETKGDNDLTSKLEEILRMTMDLSDQIRAHYTVAGKKRTRIIRVMKQWFRPIFYVMALIAGTALGVALKEPLIRLWTWLF